MGWKDAAEPVLTRLPGVERPQGHVSFNTKLMWTGAVLITYFVMTNILLFGMASGGQDLFGQFRSVLAGEQGSLMQVGIGPIVTASIVLQLLSGADLLGLDTTNNPRDQALYQGLQKLLVIIVTLMTAAPLVFAGEFLVADPGIAAALGISVFALESLLFLQVAVGGIIILYLDEIVSKWGMGSGVGLFIIAGVSQRLVGGIWEILVSYWDIIRGEVVISPFTNDGLANLIVGEGHLLPILTTILIFGAVVYFESTRVEIPLSHARVKGAHGRFPVKLIYASVLPMILVRALQANIQFMGQILNAQWASMPGWMGVYSDGDPVGGMFYYLAPIYAPQDWMWWGGAVAQETWQVLLRVSVDLTIMVVGGAIFALFWVDTTDMGPDAVASQIVNSGMQVPGFRNNEGVIEKVMERYIPYVTILGGALVGFLAVMANMLGTIGGVTGTGLLLLVSITYKLYEQLAQEKMMENPMLRKIFQD